jgi:phenylacetate-CoA ligase
MRRKIFNQYNKSPFFIKNLASNMARIIPRHIIFGNIYQNTFKNIKLCEKYSTKKLKSVIKINLAKTLSNAKDNTNYYSEKFESLGIKNSDIINDPENVLKLLPFIDKSIIRDNYSSFLSKNYFITNCDYTSTGGTSGEPFYFHIDSDRSSKEWAYFVDIWGKLGFNLYSKRASFRGSKIRGKHGWEDDWVTRERKFSSFELTDNYLDRIWQPLCSYKPNFIYAYPSTAISICNYLNRSGKSLPKSVQGILIGSENIYDGQADYIKNITGKKVVTWYGHSEKLVLAGECEKENYYHAYPQYGYSEFINKNGEAARPGEFSEIVGTGFINSIVPFIRYRTGDYCTYLGTCCEKCGRNYHIFSDVRGRWTQEVLFGYRGNSICMSAINVHSDHFKNVFRYQFYQDTPGEAILNIMPSDNFAERDKEAIKKEFNEKFNGNVIVEIKIVKEIPLTKRGKFKFIDQHTSDVVVDR